MNQPEVHEIYRRWKQIALKYRPERILVGETYVHGIEQLVSFYGSGDDELDLAFNFDFLNAPFEAEPLRRIVEEVEEKLPEGAWPVYTASNHDSSRAAPRRAGPGGTSAGCGRRSSSC